MKFSPKRLLAATAIMAFATQAAPAAFTFTNGDLILGFQATAGMGNTKNVFFNLGSPINYRNDPQVGAIGNISTTLSSVYGANWYSRTDLYFGVIGNLNNAPVTGIGAAQPANGDPSRTFYVSAATPTPGSSSSYPAGTYASTALGTAATTLGGMETNLTATTGFELTLDNAAILDQALQPTLWANGWSVRNPVPGASFGTFNGGIQQTFGKATASTFVDLQRVLATNSGVGVVTGVVGGGTYETTFAIGSNGSITAVPEPSTAVLATLGVLALLRRRRA